MKSRRRRLVVPLALTAASCSPVPRCQDVTHESNCWPDGGYICPRGCGIQREQDGGLTYDSMGNVQCLC